MRACVAASANFFEKKISLQSTGNCESNVVWRHDQWRPCWLTEERKRDELARVEIPISRFTALIDGSGSPTKVRFAGVGSGLRSLFRVEADVVKWCFSALFARPEEAAGGERERLYLEREREQLVLYAKSMCDLVFNL